MFFSIIIPVYKVEEFLPRCVDSVLKQDFKDYEVILVDDGSPDNAGRICDDYAAAYSQVKVVHKENGGLSSARNAGLDVAGGEWVWFIDSDDYVVNDSLKRLYDYVSTRDIDFLSFNFLRIWPDNSEQQLFFLYDNEECKTLNDKAVFDYICAETRNKYAWEAWANIYKRDIIEKNGLRFTDNKRIYAEDVNFALRYALYARKSYHICDIMYVYFKRDDSLSGQLNRKTLLPKLARLLEDVYREAERAGNKVVIKNFYEIYFNFIDHHIWYEFDKYTNDEVRDVVLSMNEVAFHRKMMRKIKWNRKKLKSGSPRKWLDLI